ncbi:MAG: type II secretion system F family protein [Nitrospirae bacterium]|nr:type II secretion system F family protein [Nitrospirota bacterium]
MNMALIVSVSLFISIMLLLAGAVSYYRARRRGQEIVDKIRGAEERLILDREKQEGRGGLGRYFHQFISSLGHRMKPANEEEISGLRMKLTQAGYRKPSAVLFFFGYKVFFAAVLPAVFIIFKLFMMAAVQSVAIITVAVLLALLGFYLPNLWLKMKTDVRQEKLLVGFPDALDLMVVCVEAGLGLDAAINRVGEEMKVSNALLSEEFRLLGLELRAGKTRRDALKNLGLRTGLEEVKSLMTLLIQTDKFGTSVAQALRVHSDSMRTKRYQRAEEMAAKLPVKLVFPLILFIFPALFVVIVGPAAIKIFRVLLPSMGN